MSFQLESKQYNNNKSYPIHMMIMSHKYHELKKEKYKQNTKKKNKIVSSVEF